jgi:hypothetical protein
LTREKIINEQFRETGRAINAINLVVAAVAKTGPEADQKEKEQQQLANGRRANGRH